MPSEGNKMRNLLLLFALIIFGYVGPAKALVLSDIETEIRVQIDDNTSASRQRYSDTRLDSIINEAQKEIINVTWCLEKSTSIVISTMTAYYQLPTDLIAIQQGGVRYTIDASTSTNDDITVLPETSRTKIYQDNPEWASETGEPTSYWIRQDTNTVLWLAVSPTPTTSSTGTLTMTYYCQGTDLSSDSDVPFLGYNFLYPYHIALAYYTTARIKLIEGEVAEAQAYMQLYQNVIVVMKDRLGQMPNYSPQGRAWEPRPSK